MVKSLARTTKKWKARVAVAEDDFKEGVQNPTKDWEEQAVAAKARYEAEIKRSIAEGSRETGIKRRGTAGWQARTIAKASRWGQGVNLAEEDFNDAMKEVLAFEEILQKKVLAMPNATLSDRLARSRFWQEEMAKFKKGGSS